MILHDGVRARLAASAAKMSIALAESPWSALQLIRVYPHSVPVGGRGAGGRTSVSAHGQLQVEVGYWQVLSSARDAHDGYDVMLHELAHVLDGSDGAFDGVPQAFVADTHAFERALLEASEVLMLDSELAELPLRHRALVSRAELFAVASEAYFECPEVLRTHLPALHRELALLYGERGVDGLRGRPA